MPTIHPTAIVDPAAQLSDDVDVGPYCIIGPKVSIGPGTRLISHVVVAGFTSLGAGCTVFPFASLGAQTQDLKFKGGVPGVRIGDHTTIRESVTVNAATYDGDFTTVGSHCLIMAYAHIAHDCHVADWVIMANAATLAGHVLVEERAIIGGLSAVHQFVRIGALSITGGCSKAVKDVPPFMMADGNPLAIHGVNKVGIERAGVDSDAQRALRESYKILYRRNLTTSQALEAMESLTDCPELQKLKAFVQTSERGITR